MNFEFTGAEAERREAASQHFKSVIEKYQAVHGLDNLLWDYHNWFEIGYKSGKPVHFSREYPKPYNDLHYFEYFVEKFFAQGAGQYLNAKLTQDFIGDETDASYIEGLLDEAKEVGLFTPGALVVYGLGTRRVCPPLPNGEPQVIQLQRNERVYKGNSINLDRAARIRLWLQKRSQELNTSTAIPNNLNVATEEPTNSLGPAIQPRRGRKTPLGDLRDDSVMLDEFLAGMYTDDCDIIANAVGFTPIIRARNKSIANNAPRHTAYAPAKLNAIVDALEGYLRGGSVYPFYRALAKRFGYPVAEDYEREQKDSPVYRAAKEKANKALASIVTNKTRKAAVGKGIPNQ